MVVNWSAGWKLDMKSQDKGFKFLPCARSCPNNIINVSVSLGKGRRNNTMRTRASLRRKGKIKDQPARWGGSED